MYSCPQGLQPRSMMAEYKAGLRKAGVKAPFVEAAVVKDTRRYRKVPENRLEMRLGIHKYNKPAPLDNSLQYANRVRIDLSQHIGAPASPLVKAGDTVKKGQMIAEAGGFVSSPIHSSVSGKVAKIEPRRVAAGGMVNSIIIENDGEYDEVEYSPVDDVSSLSADEIKERIKNAGVVGLGGVQPPKPSVTSPRAVTCSSPQRYTPSPVLYRLREERHIISLTISRYRDKLILERRYLYASYFKILRNHYPNVFHPGRTQSSAYSCHIR